MSNDFVFRFDNTNEIWPDNTLYADMFFRNSLTNMEYLKSARGYFFLNDALDMMRIPRIQEGQLIGWVDNPISMTWTPIEGEEAYLLEFEPDGVTYEGLPKYKNESRVDLNEFVPIRVYADWQILGDDNLDVYDHVQSWFESAINEGKNVDNLEILTSSGNGLFYVFFIVDTYLARDQSHDADEAKTVVTEFLNGIVHDTDVQVRWIEVLAP